MDRTQTCKAAGSGRSDAVDRICSLLADGERRELLRTLVNGDDRAFRFDELVAALADGRDDRSDAIATELHHSHLPKAAKAGVLDYDRRSGDVRYRGNEVLEAILDG